MSEDLVTWLRATMNALESDARSFLELHPELPDWPELTLAEIAAKRRILDLAEDTLGSRFELPVGVHDGRDPDERARDEALALQMLDVIRLLALPYADLPGYRDEWRV